MTAARLALLNKVFKFDTIEWLIKPGNNQRASLQTNQQQNELIELLQRLG